MPTFIIQILQILGLASAAAPLVEKLLTGIATVVAMAFVDIFGPSAASTELESLLTTAENVVEVVIKDAPAAADFVRNAYADLEALLAAEPWLGKLLYSTHLTQLAAAKKLDRSTLNKLNELAHANVKVKGA